MGWNFEDESKPYSSDDAYEDLEAIKAMLHEAKKKINRSKLEDSGIDISLNIELDDDNNH
ncbi:hypothetical protein [Pseudobutyrivibrio xylanivorans]|uniref:Uncharacterized protein n=1 Tax=Pseudobutyrivibrio xylanivorans TaxID=185007 RepID=A0A5P6VNY3_PSEXY|nr:hypothetical protein [Pseudobutyrivibrio xylanivorans]QFJ54122.1 hypothetical protein FXF36_04165 [Pseudobutyrivibrio xylanivorans]